MEQEQEFQVNKLMKKIKKMENETISKQLTLEQVCKRISASSVGKHNPECVWPVVVRCQEFTITNPSHLSRKNTVVCG